MRSRFAPTPSGYLHLGNILSFSLTAARAAEEGATIFLRIDDMDSARVRPAYLDDIFDVLKWLDLHWQDGPRNVADFTHHFAQENRLPLYEAALGRLRERHWLFACNCSRKTFSTCNCSEKNLGFEAQGVQWRIRTPPQWEDRSLLNFVVRKKDRRPAYQLTSVVDDLHFGIDLVVRGQDLESSTRAQFFLAEALGEARFSKLRVYHHGLLLEADGSKMSKSAGAHSVRWMREAGHHPSEVFALIGRLAQLPVAVNNWQGLAAAYFAVHPLRVFQAL